MLLNGVLNQLISDIETQQQQQQQQQPKHLDTAHSTESELVANNDAKETKTKEAISSVLTAQIDQIRAELLEEEYLNSTEPEYLDETHSWGKQLESDDYWHFVGRYE